MPSPAKANPLLGPVTCQGWTDLVRLPDGTQRIIYTLVTPSQISSVFLDADGVDDQIRLLTEARGQLSKLVLPPGTIPPGLAPPNGHPG
jgi:hypothetical protein